MGDVQEQVRFQGAEKVLRFVQYLDQCVLPKAVALHRHVEDFEAFVPAGVDCRHANLLASGSLYGDESREANPLSRRTEPVDAGSCQGSQTRTGSRLSPPFSFPTRERLCAPT